MTYTLPRGWVETRLEFPGQYLNSTLKIQRAAKQGIAAARKALKLLKDTRDKFTT